MKKKNYELIAKGDTEADLMIYGDIGDSWWSENVTAKGVVDELAELNVDYINVYINSYGGSVSDGLAIYNALRRHKAAINVSIDAVAVSIASLIAMAGDTVEMSENALFMVHAPWGGAVGNSAEMREYANVLDKFAEAMSSSYVNKTGKSKEDVMDMLTDGIDHWFTADEALENGFVDVINEGEFAAAASFNETGFKDSKYFAASLMSSSLSKEENKTENYLPSTTKLAAMVAAISKPQKEEIKMDPKNKEGQAAKTEAVNNEAAIAAAKKEGQAEAKAQNKSRVSDIQDRFSPYASHPGAQEIMAECIASDDCTPDQATQKLLAKLGEGVTSLSGGSQAAVIETEGEKQIGAAADVLLIRAGVQNMKGNGVKQFQADLNGNPFRGSTLMDIARSCIRAAGKNPDGMDKRALVSAAFQTTSDFPVLLENVMHKVLLTAYATTPDTWSRFCKIGSVSDFRAHNRYRTGSIGNLDNINEAGEYEHKTIPDGEKGTITATTKGNIIDITREVIINDDLQALTDLASMLGRSYRRTIEAAVYSLLAENSGLGPTMSDSNPLFDAAHSNLGAGAAISMAAIDADRVVMGSQTGIGGVEILDLKPDVLLVPLGLGGSARTINNAVYDPDTANKLQKPNTVNGLFSDIVDTARLTGTRRYTFANPADAPVIEVAFLDGIQEPYIEAKDGWNTDGAELKVRGDFGVAAIDYRGATTDAGA